MKELSTEEKAKRYDEAIELAKDSYNYPSYPGFIRADVVFPELKELDNERIRKVITLCLEECVHSDIIRDYEKDAALAWLEKQCKPIDKEKVLIGARKDVAMSIMDYLNDKSDGMNLSEIERKDIEDALINSKWNKLYNYMKKKLEKQGEQKPADKVKVEHLIPQKGMYYTCIKDYYSSDNTHLCVKGNIYKSFFNGYIDDESHLGLSWTNSCTEKYFEPTRDEDWIVCEHDNVIGKPMQYKEFKKKVNQRFFENLKAQGLTPKLRLWNLQDAKDGDILVYEGEIFMIKSCVLWNKIVYHCCYDGEILHMHNIYDSLEREDFDKVHPATKEQRDALEKAMADMISEVTKEKCNGCKWLIEFGVPTRVGCLNSKRCINYNEWEEKYEDLCSTKNSSHQ